MENDGILISFSDFFFCLSFKLLGVIPRLSQFKATDLLYLQFYILYGLELECTFYTSWFINICPLGGAVIQIGCFMLR